MKRLVLVFEILVILLVCSIFSVKAYSEENKKNIYSKSPANNVQKLQPIVVTPLRYEESGLNAGKSVTVIDSDAIARSGAKNMAELLRWVPGVYVTDILANGKSVSVDIGGFGEQAAQNTLFLIDGRRMNQIDLSGTDWSQVNMNAIERIEIVRGAQSVLYGNNAVGGVVNIITKKGEDVKPEIGFKYQTGSYKYNLYNGYAGGGSPFLDYFIDILSSSTEGFRSNGDLEIINFRSSFLFKPQSGLSLNVDSGYHKDWYGQPGALTLTNIDRDGPRTTTTPNDRAKTEESYILVDPKGVFDYAIGVLTITPSFNIRDRRTSSFFPSFGFADEVNNHIKSFGITPKITLASEISGMSNTIVAGVDYYNYRDEILSGAGNTKDSFIIREQTTGVYIEDTLSPLKMLSITAGYRAEWGDYRFDQQAQAHGKYKKSSIDNAVDCRVNYKYNENSALFASYARSFRLPAVDEWYNIYTNTLRLDLRPQTGNHYEIGITDNSMKHIKINASYFITDIKHELYLNPSTFTNSIYDRTARNGLELEGHVYPVEALDTYVKFMLQQSRFVGGSYAGNEIPMVPRYKLTGGFEYKIMDCASISYSINYLGDRRFISDMRNLAPKLKPYIVSDIRMGYHKYGMEIYGAIYNMFDEKYSDYGVTNFAGTSQNYYTNPGRNFVIGANYKF